MFHVLRSRFLNQGFRWFLSGSKYQGPEFPEFLVVQGTRFYVLICRFWFHDPFFMFLLPNKDVLLPATLHLAVCTESLPWAPRGVTVPRKASTRVLMVLRALKKNCGSWSSPPLVSSAWLHTSTGLLLEVEVVL